MRLSVSRLQARHWGLVGSTSAAFALTGAVTTGLGVAAGGVIIGSSVLLYALGVKAALRRQSLRLALGLLFAKLALSLGVLWALFRWGGGRIDPAGLAIGVTLLPAAALWEALRSERV